MGKKKVIEPPVVEEPKTIWWYFADDNYLGLWVTIFLVVFMFGLWYFNHYMCVGSP